MSDSIPRAALHSLRRRKGPFLAPGKRGWPCGWPLSPHDDIEVWSALDALVLKATALVLAAHCLPNLSHHCHHLQGRGGAKAAVRFVNEHLADNTFVFRTDVKSYYASIDHDILLGLLEHVVADKRVLDLIRQYLRRTIYDGGLYEDVERGISLGCPLSPLMGAFYLKLLDERVEKTGLAYARFMDDWVILAPTRWKLRAAIRLVKQTLAELHVVQHPDKTFIGRISRGFDFLGYAFTPAGLEVAPQTVERCVKRVSRLYEQGVDLIHIGAYVRRWHRWAKSRLRDSGEGLAWQVLRLTLRAVVALLFRFVPLACAEPGVCVPDHRRCRRRQPDPPQRRLRALGRLTPRMMEGGVLVVRSV